MKSIQYAGETYITGDAIADAVITYAQALAKAETSAPIEIPVIGPDGGFTAATLLLGPASQIAAIHIEGRQEEPGGEELLQAIEAKIRTLNGVEALPSDAEPSEPTAEYDHL